MPKRACTDAQKFQAPPPPPKRPGSVAPAAPTHDFADAQQQSPPSIVTLADSEEQEGEGELFGDEAELFAATAAEVENAAEIARAAVSAAETQVGEMADQMQEHPSNAVFFGKLNEMMNFQHTGFSAMAHKLWQ